MKVTLLDHTADPVQKIGRFSAICYGSKTDQESNKKRAAHCVNSGHLSTLRFAYATFHIEGISRVCLAQLTRSKHLDYLVRSSRYCNESDCKFVWPESVLELPADQIEMIEFLALTQYKALIKAGIKQQDARFFLPQSQATELYVTGNFQAWRDFIALRTTKAAQSEVREVALEIQKQLAEIAPEVFG